MYIPEYFHEFLEWFSIDIYFLPYTLVLRSKTIVDTDPVLREIESESDCLADRAVALDEQKSHVVNFLANAETSLVKIISIR